MAWDVNWWAVLVATIAYFALGAGWYMALGKAWMAALGMTEDHVAGGPHPGIYALTFLLDAVAVFTVAVVLANATVGGVGGGAALGALLGVGIWFALLSVTFMFEGRRPALFLIDGGYHVLALTIAGAILGALPPA
jgi:hypothetical protein